MLGEGAIQPDAPVACRAHERDSPAGAIRLGVKYIVGGARRQAEATVDALIELLPEVGRGHGDRWHGFNDSTHALGCRA